MGASTSWNRSRGSVLVAAGLLVLVADLDAASELPSWRVERGDVRIVVPMKPGGAFEARTSSLEGTLTLAASSPLSLGGMLSLKLATIDTGIALRDRHLTESYLEVSKGPDFATAELSEIVLLDASDAGFQGRTGFEGTLLLHGVSRPIVGEGRILGRSASLRVEATFTLSLGEFGIEPPVYMGVGVGSKVLVKVAFTAVLAQAARE